MKKLFPFLMGYLFFMAADTGGSGGGSPPDPSDLAEWIERLDAAAKKDRQAIIDELAKALSIPVADTVGKLKKAGWDPKKKAPSDEETTENGASSDQQGKKTEGNGTKATVSLRHKTPHPRYRRAGLVLTDQFNPYEVTAEQLEKLKKDPWVEIGK